MDWCGEDRGVGVLLRGDNMAVIFHRLIDIESQQVQETNHDISDASCVHVV